MTIKVVFPRNMFFPLEITDAHRLVIQRKQIHCTEIGIKALDSFHVQEIKLRNQTSSKTLFDQDDIETTVAAIVYFLTFKYRMKIHQNIGTVSAQQTFRLASLASKAAIEILKGTSDAAGLFWAITEGAAQDIPPPIPWG